MLALVGVARPVVRCARSATSLLQTRQPIGAAGRFRCVFVGVGQARAMSAGIMSRTTPADKSTLPQPLYPTEPNATEKQYHDSLQYHFFFDGIFVAGRVFHTATLQQHSAWMYDTASGQMTELFEPSYDKMTQSEQESSLNLDSKHLQITDGPNGGSFIAKEKSVRIAFKQDHVFTWAPSGQGNTDGVIHRPDLRCKLEFNGKSLEGVGYSKRYYGLYPRFWGYRFIHGHTLESQPTVFWNADAAFGDNKYNYFKVLPASGELISAQTEDTWQQDTSGYAIIDGVRHETRISPLCTWETVIGGAGKNMESKMQNRYCNVELIVGDSVKRGFAYNERCYGTLG